MIEAIMCFRVSRQVSNSPAGLTSTEAQAVRRLATKIRVGMRRCGFHSPIISAGWSLTTIADAIDTTTLFRDLERTEFV